MDITPNIKARRKALGITQKEAGARARMDQGQWNGLERGKHSPTLNTLERLAEALECRPVDLMIAEEK